MPHVFVIRHGQTTHNASGVVQGPRIDALLSELGEKQAAALGKAFASTHLDAVFVSPMLRARATAQGLLAGHVDTAARVVPELYEMDFGDHCGRRYDDVRPDIERLQNEWTQGFIDRAFPGGESPLLAQHRVRALAEHVRTCGRDQDIAVVAHGRINRILLATLTGAPLSQMHAFGQSNAGITHLEVASDGVHMRRMNDTAHLT